MFYQTVLLIEFQNTEITNVGSSLSFNLYFVSHVSRTDPPISFTLGGREQGAGRGRSGLLNRAWQTVTFDQHVKIPATV
jgi:hypothetical protein